MNHDVHRPPSPRAARWLGHVGATVLVMLAGGFPTTPAEQLAWSPDVASLNLVAAAVLLLRHRAPLVVAGVVVALVAASVPLGLFNPGTVVAAAVATYTVVRRVSHRRGLVTTLAMAAAMTGAAIIAGDAAPQHGLAVLVGGMLADVVRTQRAHLDAITERAERAEQTREAMARQRVAEDRLSTARDLHDVVAHQIAVINLHAGVASAALRERPLDAEPSLAVIRAASRTVLTEIGDLLATLRDPLSANGAPVGLAQIDDVVRGFASDGLDVTLRAEGAPPVEMPRTVDVTALRVVQEALTNAHKHGVEHRAHVLVEHLPGRLRLTVSNPIDPSQRVTGIGNRQGLIGMSERVESVRGSLEYGSDGFATWTLVADLPLTAGTGPGTGEEGA